MEPEKPQPSEQPLTIYVSGTNYEVSSTGKLTESKKVLISSEEYLAQRRRKMLGRSILLGSTSYSCVAALRWFSPIMTIKPHIRYIIAPLDIGVVILGLFGLYLMLSKPRTKN